MTDAEKLAMVETLMNLREKGKISCPAVAIGLAIIENADSDGRCSVSRADLGKRAGIERIPTVSAKVTELRKAGFMEVGWSCRINNYALPVSDVCAPAPSISNGKRYASTIKNNTK